MEEKKDGDSGLEYVVDIRKVANDEDAQMVILPFAQRDTGKHKHLCFELAYVTGGSAVHLLNGEEIPVFKGDFFFLDYESVHGYARCQDFSVLNCLFLPEMIDNTLAGCCTFDEFMRVCLIRYYKQYFGYTAVNRIFRDEDGQILKLLQGAQAEWEEKETGYGEIFRCRLLEILIRTMRKAVGREHIHTKKQAESTVVLEMLEYMNTNLGEHAVLKQFCEAYHYSLPYISNRFKKETGFSALEYLQKKRLEKACRLLAGSNMTIQKIAQEVGYEDVKYFGQIFKRMLHMAPGEFRKMCKTG